MDTVTAIILSQAPIALACLIIAVQLYFLKRDFVKILSRLSDRARKR
ncbi:MAG: hypothetical protein ABH879_03880 [archaeon]